MTQDQTIALAQRYVGVIRRVVDIMSAHYGTSDLLGAWRQRRIPKRILQRTLPIEMLMAG